MSRISSTGITTSSGLVSGIPIQDTVDQLIAISARPRDLLSSRTNGLQSERAAVDTLSSLVLSFRSSLDSLNLSSAFEGRDARSSSDSVTVSVASGATPTLASYQFTPLRSASASQYVTSSIPDPTAALGSGTLRLGVGGQLDKGIRLSELNSGAGFSPGEVRITDRSGASATIDLRAATNVDDILREINNANDVDVTASVSGDRFVLTDTSGGSGTLAIEDLSGGSAAASLGLAGVAPSGVTLTGSDVYGLTTATRLDTLNNGRGVELDGATAVDDLTFTFRDETTGGVDLADAATLGDVIDAINNDADLSGKISASVSSDGNRIELTDLTTPAGSGTFTVSNGLIGSAADDLGLTADTDGDATLTGSRLVSGLNDTLLSSLNGGAGVDLAGLSITDRTGANDTIDLSNAETVQDVIDTINGNGTLNVTARISDTRGGIVIESSGTDSNLIIAENGGTTAADLGLTIDSAVGSVDSGLLGRSTVGRTTLLSDLNSGNGVSLGEIEITDSSGAKREIDLEFNGEDAPTLGDVIDEINKAAPGVTASINQTGDGILLTDIAGGTGTLTVAEVGSGTTAADLRLLGTSSSTDEQSRQTIDGASGFSIDLSEIESTGVDTPISALRSGQGIDQGVFRIFDSTYVEGNTVGTAVVNLNDAATLGDIVDRINAASGVSVTAALNNSGTAITLTDDANGSGDLIVEDLGSGTAAADLGLEGTFSAGTVTGSAVLSSAGGLELLATRINDSGSGFSASVVFDGFGYRLSVASDQTGADSELLIDAGSTSLSFSETSRGGDAVALFGTVGSGGFTVVSDDGTYNDLIDGVNLSVSDADGQAVTLDVVNDDSSLVRSVQGIVDSYNSLRANLDAVTDFDEATETTGILFGSTVAVQVDTQLSRALSGRFTFGTSFTSLESVGVSLNDDGTLSLDESKLRDALTQDRDAVEQLFQDENNGVVAELQSIADRLAGTDGLLDSRSDALDSTIETNNERIADLDASLELERERLLLQFIRLEETIAGLSANTDLISSIQPITISNSSNNN